MGNPLSIIEHRDLPVLLSFLTGTSRILQRSTCMCQVYSCILQPCTVPSVKEGLMLFLHLALAQNYTNPMMKTAMESFTALLNVF